MRPRLVEMLGGRAFVAMRKSEEVVIHRISIRHTLGASGLGAYELLPEPVGEV